MASPSGERPNFLVIVADDLGFSDLSCFGGEIHTPNLDRLAKNGVRFTDMHAAAACSPSRSMILTGTDNHIAGLGNLIEWTNNSGQNAPAADSENDWSTAPQRGMPGYEGYLNERVVALPELLHDAGYLTLMSGKWHLGLRPEHSPKARGFERSLAHRPACSNHYAWEPRRRDGDEQPKFLEKSVIALHSEDGEAIRHMPEDWYSSNGYGDKMVAYLQDRNDSGDVRPFFGYLPFTAPHWPLQAPDEFVEKYKGVYDDGPEALRQRRLKTMKELGLATPDVVPHPVVAEDVSPWEDMSDLQRQKSCKAMEVFAGMVECIDHNVGKVVDFLERSGELENTFVCFMSDNGAEGAAYEAYPIVQGHMMEHLQKYYNNSLENIGRQDSFVWYGPLWAQASTAPSRLYKAYTTEGGIRVPFLARFPQSFTSSLHSVTGRDDVDQRAEGTVSHTFSTVMDLVPTILTMAGITHPTPSYKGREIVGMRGKSILPYISGHAPSIHASDHIHGWETCGRAAVRCGDWKIVFVPKPKGPEKWQLYNLKLDPGETNDLAASDPERMRRMLKMWDNYVLETGVIPLAPELGEFIEATEAQMTPDIWLTWDYWKDGARDDPERFYRDPPRFQRAFKPI